MIVDRAQTTLEEALGKAQPIASAVISKLRSISSPPDEVVVEFGLSLSAEAGAVLTSVSTEANVKLTLTWKQTPAGQS